jgi:hypothetical protein
MRIVISPDEAKIILNQRAWRRVFKAKRIEFPLFGVIAPPVVVVFATVFLFTNGGSDIVDSVFLALGIICLPFTLKALRKFKVLQNQIQAEMIAEEKENRKKEGGI